MAYSPFYITPEELAVYQEAQEQEILSGDNLTTWRKYDIEEANRFSYIFDSLVPIAIMSVVLFLFWYTLGQDPMMGYVAVSVLIMGYGLSYLLFGLDYRYDYIFSSKGFVMRKRRNMPKWVNTATQAVGWIGTVVCLVMVALVGPMALAGAGAFILLSFGMLKRQPDEPTEVRVGEREDWLFADYNKKRKVLQFYFKYDRCEYQDTAQKIVFRSQDRFDCYVFFKTEADLESMVAQLSKVYKLNCTEVDDHKKLFEAKPESRLFSIPVCSREYQTDEVFNFRASNAPLPEREYLYNGKWQTESEIEQSKSKLTTALE
ncbi:hypothetical protein RB979_002926 [Vibrio alginolyticus]|uniref:hypothetical protein n=1 Tax=Vibrio alginolyticus TaxID=663 RepID=UPI0014288629|nr:hypothetical protein [Vibrio alginolyticus]QIR89015.1 hypothetical protein FQ332_10295 [Vibrio diabolicus]EGR0267541.1 hypothetical protein [Vibrio alginolyticus]EKM3678440.1 hypothetical protein [Vibrio alginolyticus]ELA6780684.1 hypothetical protein [Vibrio alginolyticus]MBS9928943.1 hypothetical protein [Vibrio alginolyticus]